MEDLTIIGSYFTICIHDESMPHTCVDQHQHLSLSMMHPYNMKSFLKITKGEVKYNGINNCLARYMLKNPKYIHQLLRSITF